MANYRFNLITHGLMAIWQEGEKLHILVPNEKGHTFKMGSPFDSSGNVSVNNLIDMPKGRVELHGVKPGKLDTGSRLCAQLRSPILDKRYFRRSTDTAAVRTEFVVPVPDIIRSYCGAEVDPIEVCGTTPGVKHAPEISEEVVVLSWGTLDPAETQWKMSDGAHKLSFSASGILNFGIYAQETDEMALSSGHGESWNRMFVDITKRHPSMKLSFPGIKADLPPLKTAIGVSKPYLDCLADLAANGNVTDRMGCGLASFLEF